MDDEIQKEIREILGRVIRMETKIDNYNEMKEKVDRAYNQSFNNKEDIAELKENNKWLWRTVAGALIISFIGAFLMWR